MHKSGLEENTNDSLRHRRSIRRLRMNGVGTTGSLGSVKQVRRKYGIHVDGTRQALDVAEEAHAAESAIGLRHKCAVEADHDRNAVHHSLKVRSRQCKRCCVYLKRACDALALHSTVSVLDHHRELLLKKRYNGFSASPCITWSAFAAKFLAQRSSSAMPKT